MDKLDIRLKTLSPEHLRQWDCDGVLVLRAAELYGPDLVAAIRRWTDEVQAWPETPGKWMMYFEKSLKDGARILNRMENFFPYHDGFNRLFNTDWALGLAAQLLGGPAVAFKEKINFKLPGGGAFAAHQDVQAGWDRYGQSVHISLAVAVDAATIENGCLEVVRGEHKKGLIGPMGAEIPKDVCDKLTWEPVLMEPGDMIFFDSFAPHRSAPNLTASTRRVIYLTYNKASEGDTRERYYADKRQSFPPDIERDPSKQYAYKI
jgi:2-aminoethylphosphonate dioxygenase